MSTEANKKLSTVADVMDRFGLSRAYISKLLRQGRLSHFKVGARVLFSEEHLDQFLKAHERPATKPLGRPRRSGVEGPDAAVV
jgi:excisionase family DNA binding protein